MDTYQNIAPAPPYPEKGYPQYERAMAFNGVRRGPMRFQEGVATDTDVPNDFMVGIQQAHMPAPGRMNRNSKVDTKYPEETLRQRAHVGSAAWVEGPQYLGEFAHGSFGDAGHIQYERIFRPEGKQYFPNPAQVWD